MATDLRALLALLGADTSGVPQEYRPPDDPAALEPSGYARERPLTLPVSRGGRFLDNFAATLAETPPPQVRRGAGSGERFLAGALGGTARGFSRARLTEQAERELFARSEAGQTQARVKDRDASFKSASAKAAAVKRDRIAQMRTAIGRWESEADRADTAARNAIPGDTGQQASFLAKRDRALGEIARIDADLARLEGRTASARPAPATITARTAKPKTPPKPKEEPDGEVRRRVIAAITVENGNDPVRVRAYLNRPGVLDTLAKKYGITQAEVLRAVPE